MKLTDSTRKLLKAAKKGLHREDSKDRFSAETVSNECIYFVLASLSDYRTALRCSCVSHRWTEIMVLAWKSMYEEF